MSNKPNPARIGGFVIGAVAIAVAAVATFGSGRFFERAERFVCYFEGSVNGLAVGSNVKFKGVPIGSVSEILLRLDQAGGSRRSAISVVIDIDERKIERSAGRPIDLDNPEVLEEMIIDGLRASLEPESLVTGMLYVNLDFYPGVEPVVLVQDGPMLAIPTLPSTLEALQKVLGRVVRDLGSVDFKAVFRSVEETIQAIHDVLTSPEIPSTVESLSDTMESLRELSQTLNEKIGPFADAVEGTAVQADQTLDELRKTLESVQLLIEPESPMAYQLGETLRQISGAADSLRELATFLEEHPSSLLYGRGSQESEN